MTCFPWDVDDDDYYQMNGSQLDRITPQLDVVCEGIGLTRPYKALRLLIRPLSGPYKALQGLIRSYKAYKGPIRLIRPL